MRGILLTLVMLGGNSCHLLPKHVAPHPATAAPAVTAPGSDAVVTKGALPAGWPDYIPPYPAAEIVEGQASHSSGAPVLTAKLRSKDEAEQIVAYYGLRLSEKKFSVVSTSQVAGETVSVYRHETQSVSVGTERATAATVTNVEITVVGTYDAPQEAEPPAAQNNGGSAGGGSPEHKDKVPVEPLMPHYPGANVDAPRVFGTQTVLRMRTADSREQVLTYYEDFYTQQGFAAQGRSVIDDQLSETFTGGQGMVSVIAKKSRSGEAQTSISLSYDAKPH